MIIQNLLKRKVRTFFSVFGVGVGISLMVALFTISEDLVGQVRQIYDTSRGDIRGLQITREEFDSQIELVQNEENILEEIRTFPNVKSVSPMIWSYLRTERAIGGAGQINYYGVTSDSPLLRSYQAIEHAEPGAPLIDDQDPQGFIVGRRLFELANERLPEGKKLKIGQELSLTNLLLTELSQFFIDDSERFQNLSEKERQLKALKKLNASNVDGLAATNMKLYLRAVFSAQDGISEYSIVFPLKQAQALRKMENQCTSLLIELEDTSEHAKNLTTRKLNQTFDTLNFMRSDQVVEEIPELKFIERIALGISLIAALAGAFGVLNTMVLSVHERTREIGLLLALGWSRSKIMRQIVSEGTMITLLGACVGILLGYAEVLLIRKLFDLWAINPRLSLSASVYAFGLACVLGILASAYPAWRASRLTPVDALRHE